MKKLILGIFATVLFSSTSFAQASYKYIPSDDQLEALAKLSASDFFVDINKRLSEVYTSPSKRAEADRIASVNEFVRLGGKSHEEMRLSLRDFESTTSVTRDLDFIDFDILEKQNFGLPINGVMPSNPNVNAKAGKNYGTLCLSVGAIVCVSWGSEINAAVQTSAGYDPQVSVNDNRLQESREILFYLRDFAANSNFQKLLNDLYSLKLDERDLFVKNVILNNAELKRRGITLPSDIIIQRSAFSDDRPTLFCIVKYKADRKTKLTLTFDS